MPATSPPRFRPAALILTWLALGAACAAPDTGSALIERQAVVLNLLRDGSVEVRETLTVRFTGRPVTRFNRQVAGDRVDAVIDVRAAIDGQPVPTDAEVATHAAIDRGRTLDVEWRFPAVSDTQREFTLEYRAVGALAVSGANAQLSWRLLPFSPAYPVAATVVTLSVPRGTVFMTPPLVDAGDAWQTEVTPTGLTARRDGIAPGETAALHARLATDTLAIARPDWQFDAALAAELMPAFISGGLFMVIVGAGILWMLRVRYPAPRRVPEDGPSRLPSTQPALLVDPERMSVASGLKVSGVATLLMALACAAAVPIWLARYGPWAYAVPAGVAILGLMLLVAGARFVILTPAGERAAGQ